jgi:hypothetical protein
VGIANQSNGPDMKLTGHETNRTSSGLTKLDHFDSKRTSRLGQDSKGIKTRVGAYNLSNGKGMACGTCDIGSTTIIPHAKKARDNRHAWSATYLEFRSGLRNYSLFRFVERSVRLSRQLRCRCYLLNDDYNPSNPGHKYPQAEMVRSAQ